MLKLYSIVFVDDSLPLQNVKHERLYEAINLKYALTYSLAHLDKFDNELIQQIGIIINKNIADISGYRKSFVFIRGADFVPPEAAFVPSQMSEIIYQYENSDLSLLEKVSELSYSVLNIFILLKIGNGRTGRVLINHQLLMNDGIPIVIPEERRTEYFGYLQKL